MNSRITLAGIGIALSVTSIPVWATHSQGHDEFARGGLVQEILERQAADADLQAQIDAKIDTNAATICLADHVLLGGGSATQCAPLPDTSALEADLAAEAAARADGDSALRADLDLEAQARADADAAETDARVAADAALQAAIATEETARVAADQTLSNDLATETAARSDADSELQNQINAIVASTGPGSGLNADLLDGLDSSDFAPLNHDHDARYPTFTDIMPIVLANDGAGSTLDADTVDGLQANEILAAAQGDARTPINIDGLTISDPGSYFLTRNLSVPSHLLFGLRVEADDVTVDLMGFTISGPGSGDASNVRGIQISNRRNVTIQNGTIQGFPLRGIETIGPANEGHRLINVRVIDNGRSGIFLSGDAHLIKDSMAIRNNLTGIFASRRSVIIGNTSFNNGTNGIFAGEGSVLSNNVVANNGGTGIFAGPAATITKNTSYSNGRWGIEDAIGQNNLVIGNTAFNNDQSNVSSGNIAPCNPCTVIDNHAP